MRPRRTNPLPKPAESEKPMGISWAEMVPDAPYPMSADEFEGLPDDNGWQYELIDGRLVRMPGNMGNSIIASRLNARLTAYVEPRGLGYVGGEAGLFRFIPPGKTDEQEAAPDVSFVRVDRAPGLGSREWYKPWRVIPDLAVEIVSPRQDIEDKITLWMSLGVRLLWVIYPLDRRVEVYRQGHTAHETLGMADVLNGEDVVPGFVCPIRSLL